MPMYKVEFTAKGYIEIAAENPDTAHEKALDIVHGMSEKTFAHTFADDVQANDVECIEGDMNPHDHYLDLA